MKNIYKDSSLAFVWHNQTYDKITNGKPILDKNNKIAQVIDTISLQIRWIDTERRNIYFEIEKL